MMYLIIANGRKFLPFVKGWILESGGMENDQDILNIFKINKMSYGRNCLPKYIPIHCIW